MKKLITSIILSSIYFINFSQNFYDFLPNSNGEIVNHKYYSLSYSEEYEQAEWVFYEIKKERTLGLASRVNNFRSDEKVNSNSATIYDYKGSGYDRGHLAPAADFSFSSIAMSESFYMSNISPQNPSFNRGIWKKLEHLVRTWGSKSSLYVATGPFLDDCSLTIGINKVCVPKFYYKVIYEPKDKKMIAFVLSNEKGQYNLSYYVTSVDFVEKKTDIDFFPLLEDKLEQKLESEIKIENWSWNE